MHEGFLLYSVGSVKASLQFWGVQDNGNPKTVLVLYSERHSM